jgi:hypothetical protein
LVIVVMTTLGCRMLGRLACGIFCAARTSTMSATTVTNTPTVKRPEKARSSSLGTRSL